jgi:hypothetical protein
MTQKMMSGPRLHPDKRQESYAPQREKRQNSTTSIQQDLNVWGHSIHHYRAGCEGEPVDSPSFPNTLRESVRRALQQNEDYHEENDTFKEIRHVGLLPRCLKMCYPNDLIDELDDHSVRKGNARPFTEINLAKQRVYELELEDWIKEGRIGPLPVMTTLTNTGRASRVDYFTAEQAQELGKSLNTIAANLGVNALTTDDDGGSSGVLRRTRVSGMRRSLARPAPDSTRVLVKDPMNFHVQQKERRAAKQEEERLRQMVRDGKLDPSVLLKHKKAPTRTPVNEYDNLPTTESLMPPSLSDNQQQQTVVHQDQTVALQAQTAVHQFVRRDPGYTVVDGVVVVTNGLRARAPPLVSSTNTTTTDGFTSLSSSTSSSASSAAAVPSTTARPSKKAPPLKKARLASEVYDENARAILLQNASTGLESASMMLEEENNNDGDNSRSRLGYEHAPTPIVNDDAMPTSGFLDDDDDDDLEDMEVFNEDEGDDGEGEDDDGEDMDQDE